MPCIQNLQTQRVSIIVTKSCSLKCKLCGALSPYIKSYHPSIEFLKREADAFFGIVDRTGIIDISGGEPLLRGIEADFALGELLIYLAAHYSERFDRLRIFTNGTIVPDDKLCDVFRLVSLKANFSITIDDYGRYSTNVADIANKLSAYGVKHHIRDYINDVHCGGWVDLRDTSLKNSEKEAKRIFSKCAIPQKLGCCLELVDGIMSPCSVAAARYICGEAERDSEDIIDLWEDPAEMRSKLSGILSAGHFQSCLYCSGGMADDSKRFTPAQQAEEDEIEAWGLAHAMRFR